MAFKFYIDGQLTDQPVNDTGVITSIVRDTTIKAVLVDQNIDLLWAANNNLQSGYISGFTYLKDKFDEGICGECSLAIYDQVSDLQTVLIYEGVIKTPSMKFDKQREIVTVNVNDNNYYSYLNNNRGIKVLLTADKTKSKLEITPPSPYELDLFNSNGCAYGSFAGFYYQAYWIVDVFEHIIKCLTDNRLGFRSDFLTNLDYPLFLCKGQNLINAVSFFPTAQGTIEISFEQIFTELNKIYNLSFYIDNSDNLNPVFVIEDTNSLYSQDAAFYHFADIKEMSENISPTELYGVVTAGDANYTDGQQSLYTWNSAISYYGWRDEQFFPLGQCNTNQELNLRSEWSIDNNIIQDTLVGQNNSNIDKIFLIECENRDSINLTAQGQQYSFFGQGGCFYNLGLNNFSKLKSHASEFETVFGNFLGLGDDGFRALLGNSPVQDINYVTSPASAPNFIPLGGLTVNPAQYVNETSDGGFDGNNNYNNATQRYIVPSDGNYSFRQSLQWDQSGFIASEYFQIAATITLYDSLLVQKAIFTTGSNYGGNGSFELNADWVVNAVAGDIVIASYGVGYVPNQAPSQQLARNFYLKYTSFFECNGTPEGGISITSGNGLIKKIEYTFEYDINQDDFLLIKANPLSRLSFEKDGITRFGWIKSIQHNNWTGMTNIKLITNNATTTV
jgi:hypothetical protein